MNEAPVNRPNGDHTFSLLTVNTFGGFLWQPRRRLPALRREVDALAADAVCLQEIQSPLAQRIFSATSRAYPHCALQPARRHPLGALCTLSRHPIAKQHFVRYTNQGPRFGPTIMDRLTRKGVLISQLNHGSLAIRVLNTHILANYWAQWQPTDRAARQQATQLQQLANIVNEQPTDALLLVAGDFNIPRGSWLYREFLETSGLVDALADDKRPTYRPFPGVPAHYAQPIDFIFLRAPTGLALHWDAALHFMEPVAYQGRGDGHLTDHLGVQVHVAWTTNG